MLSPPALSSSKEWPLSPGYSAASLESAGICEGEICGTSGTLPLGGRLDSAWQVRAVKSLFNLKHSPWHSQEEHLFRVNSKIFVVFFLERATTECSILLQRLLLSTDYLRSFHCLIFRHHVMEGCHGILSYFFASSFAKGGRMIQTKNIPSFYCLVWNWTLS